MIRSYRYRLFTNANQERELERTLETHRRLYNTVLDGKILCWETAGTNWSFYEQCNWLSLKRKSNPHLLKVNAKATTQTLRRLDKAFKAFFARAKRGDKPGHPRFKSKDHFNSFTFCMNSKSGSGCKVVDGKLRLQHIGMVRVRWHRELPENGETKTATIKRYASKWYVIFTIEMPDNKPLVIPPDRIGVDVGLRWFATTSDGSSLGEVGYLKNSLTRLRVIQRHLCRQKKGGVRRGKTRLMFQKCHAKVADSRRDMHFKVAKHLTDRYGLIAVESLRIGNMLKNRRLSRAISDAGWGQFLEILKAKAESAGVKVVEVDARDTSQDCSQCGERVQKDLSVRVHRCGCGLVLDRDINAARNILGRAGPSVAKLANTLV